MDPGQNARQAPRIRERVQVARACQDRVVVRPRMDSPAPIVSSHAPGGSRQDPGGVGQGRGGRRQIQNDAHRDELDQAVDRGDDRDHDEQREGNVPPRIAELSRRRRRVLEAGVGEEEEERRLSQPAALGGGDAAEAVPVEGEDPRGDQEEEGNDLPHHEEDGRPRPVLDAENVDPGEPAEAGRSRAPARDRLRAAPDRCESLGEADGQARHGRDAGDPGHPAHLEPDELPERRSGVHEAAPRASKRLPASAKQRTRSSTQRPARGTAHTLAAPINARRGGGEQVDPASDHVVQGEADDLPA